MRKIWRRFDLFLVDPNSFGKDFSAAAGKVTFLWFPPRLRLLPTILLNYELVTSYWFLHFSRFSPLQQFQIRMLCQTLISLGSSSSPFQTSSSFSYSNLRLSFFHPFSSFAHSLRTWISISKFSWIKTRRQKIQVIMILAFMFLWFLYLVRPLPSFWLVTSATFTSVSRSSREVRDTFYLILLNFFHSVLNFSLFPPKFLRSWIISFQKNSHLSVPSRYDVVSERWRVFCVCFPFPCSQETFHVCFMSTRNQRIRSFCCLSYYFLPICFSSIRALLV